jgi:hypothetical protein
VATTRRTTKPSKIRQRRALLFLITTYNIDRKNGIHVGTIVIDRNIPSRKVESLPFRNRNIDLSNAINWSIKLINVLY